MKNYYRPFATEKDGHIIVGPGDICLCGSYPSGTVFCGELLEAVRRTEQLLQSEKKGAEDYGK